MEQDTQQIDPTDGLRGIQAATEAGKRIEYQRAKLQFHFKGLQLITNPFTTSFGEVKRKAPVAQTEDPISNRTSTKIPKNSGFASRTNNWWLGYILLSKTKRSLRFN